MIGLSLAFCFDDKQVTFLHYLECTVSHQKLFGLLIVESETTSYSGLGLHLDYICTLFPVLLWLMCVVCTREGWMTALSCFIRDLFFYILLQYCAILDFNCTPSYFFCA